jgi:predicted TIM-barrel fold metal-dependent hydrolase
VIIDCHCHAGTGDTLTAPWNTRAPLARYLRRARAAGIDRTIFFPAFQSDYIAGNRQVARIVRRLGTRATGFAMVHAGRDAGRIDEMLGEAVRLGLRGVKVHGHDHMPTRELCDVLSRLGLPMLLDVAGKAHVIDMLAPEYPRINFIIAHLGSFADDWRAHERVIEQLVRYPNLHADTSGVRRFDYIVQALERAGPRKILFGSDGPWLHPGVEIAKIRLLGLSTADESLVLGGNARRLLARHSGWRLSLDDRRPMKPEASLDFHRHDVQNQDRSQYTQR